MVVADSPSAEPRPVRARGRPGFRYALAGRRGAVGPQFPGPCAGSRWTPPFVKSSPHARFKVGSAAGPQSPRSGRPRPAARRRAAPRAPPSIRRGAAPAPAAAPLPALSYDLEFLVCGRDTLRAAGPLGSAPFSRPGLGRATSRARASRPGPASERRASRWLRSSPHCVGGLHPQPRGEFVAAHLPGAKRRDGCLPSAVPLICTCLVRPAMDARIYMSS